MFEEILWISSSSSGRTCAAEQHDHRQWSTNLHPPALVLLSQDALPRDCDEFSTSWASDFFISNTTPVFFASCPRYMENKRRILSLLKQANTIGNDNVLSFLFTHLQIFAQRVKFFPGILVAVSKIWRWVKTSCTHVAFRINLFSSASLVP